jgi:glycosyltransferase involved in cell wall biosynthesis
VNRDATNAAVNIAFADYSDDADISGVTTWLAHFIRRLAASEPSGAVRTALHVHHIGARAWQESSIVRDLAGVSVELSGTNIGDVRYTEDSVADTLAFLNRTRPDVFLPQCLPGFHFAAVWAARLGLPWVLTMHADDPDYWGLVEECGPDAGRGACVAVSEYLADRVRERRPTARVVTIPCGVAIPPATARFSSAPFRVVYSGRLVEHQKRASLVAATLIAACRRSAAIEAIVMGDGAARPAMEAAVAAAGLADRIRFTGRLTPDAVAGQLQEAQAILLMSDFEGLPVALLEAMAAGVVPVARSIASGVGELVRDGDTGILVDEAPDTAAAALARLAATPDAWERMSAAARRLVVERYSDTVCFGRWQALITELAAASTIRYPIDVPATIRLAPVHPLNRRMDQRRPRGWRRLASAALGVARRLKRAVAGCLRPGAAPSCRSGAA